MMRSSARKRVLGVRAWRRRVAELLQVPVGQTDRLRSCRLSSRDSHGARRKRFVFVEGFQQAIELGEGRQLHRLLADRRATAKSLGVPSAVPPKGAERGLLPQPAGEQG